MSHMGVIVACTDLRILKDMLLRRTAGELSLDSTRIIRQRPEDEKMPGMHSGKIRHIPTAR